MSVGRLVELRRMAEIERERDSVPVSPRELLRLVEAAEEIGMVKAENLLMRHALYCLQRERAEGR